MKYAIVGCGEMGWAHARAYRKMGAQIVAVCDMDTEKARQLAAFCGCASEDDLEEMLKKHRVDGLSICTPPFHHLPAMEIASRYSCGILCEKPFVLAGEEIDAAAKAVQQSGRAFQIGFKFRYEALYRTAREIVAQNAIGRVQYVFISHFQPIAPRLWKMKAGIVKELLVHACDITCCLFDAFPRTLSLDAQSLIEDFEGDDRALLTLEFSDHRKAVIAGGYMPGFSRDPARLAQNDIAFQVVGENGYFAALRNGDVTLCNPDGVKTWHPDESKTAFDYEMEAFERAIAGNPTGPSLREAIASQLILERAYEVRNCGKAQPVSIPEKHRACFGAWAQA